MTNHPLFDLFQITLPEDWQLEAVEPSEETSAKGQPSALECDAWNEAQQGGHLNIKCYQFPTNSEAQREHLVGSVYAQTEKKLLSEGVYWGIEELQGEEDGEQVAIFRWLVCSLLDQETFSLLIFNYSVEAGLVQKEAVSAEISMLEQQVQAISWL